MRVLSRVVLATYDYYCFTILRLYPIPHCVLLIWIAHCYTGSTNIFAILYIFWMHIHYYKWIIKGLYDPQNYSWIYKLFSHICKLMVFISLDLNLFYSTYLSIYICPEKLDVHHGCYSSWAIYFWERISI